MPRTYDAIVLGAGVAGGNVADAALREGHRVALAYLEPWGSTCANTGCVPSKFLLHRARVAHLARHAERYHVTARDVDVDVAGLIDEKVRLVTGGREKSFEGWRDRDNLTLYQGAARFTGPHEVEVNGHRLHAPRIFIATGLRPLVPPIEGLDDVPYLTSEGLMRLRERPDHLVVIGGGYVGCELGQAWHRFGSQVTLLQGPDRLLPREEPEVHDTLRAALDAEGVRVLTGHRVQRVERDGDGGVRVTAQPEGRGPVHVTGSHLLVATGRRPNTDTLGLDAAGIDTDEKGHVRVDDTLQTNVAGVYAVGDVNGHQPYTRVGSQEAQVAYKNAFHDRGLRITRPVLPHGVFTDPGVGRVGQTEAEARAAGDPVLAIHHPLEETEKAWILGDADGFVKLVVHRDTRRLLGATVVAPDAPDHVYAPALVVRHGGTVDELALTVGTFPTLQEAVEQAARKALQELAPDRAEPPAATLPVTPP